MPHDRTTRFALLACLSLLPQGAWAGGCSPAPAVAANLPPCCATTNMAQGGRCSAPAAQYQFTIASFGFEKNDGTEIQFGSPRLFDAASVNAGSTIGDYLGGIDLPAATYVALRPTLGAQITVRADSLTGDGRHCTGSLTTAARQPDGSPWPVCRVGEPNAATSHCLSGGLLKIRNDRLGAFTVNSSSTLNLNIAFDVNNGVVCTFAPGTGPSTAVDLGVLSVDLSKS